MLGKIYKHEFKQTSKIIPWLYLILLFCSLTLITGYKLDISWLIITGYILCVFCSIAIIVSTLIIIISRFYKSMFSNEGYLTYTLPMKPSSNLFPKLTVALFWLIIDIVVIFSVVLMVLFSFNIIDFDYLEHFSRYLQGDILHFVIFFAVTLFIQSIFFLSTVFFAISLGNVPMFHKLSFVGPILFYFVINIVMEVLNILSIFIPFGISVGSDGFSFVFKSMYSSFNEHVGSNITIGISSIIFQIIGIFVLYFVTKYIIDKKVSLK